jgi:hypothetical protein
MIALPAAVSVAGLGHAIAADDRRLLQAEESPAQAGFVDIVFLTSIDAQWFSDSTSALVAEVVSETARTKHDFISDDRLGFELFRRKQAIVP